MLQIAVCDDSPRDLNTFIALLQQYLQRHPETTAQIVAFENGEEMLSKVKEGNVYDIVFLDIIMPAPDGIETGWRLRALGSNSLLIYLTCSKEYAIDSYDVRAYHYLLKPIDTESFIKCLMLQSLNVYNRKKNTLLCIMQRERTVYFLDKFFILNAVADQCDMFVKTNPFKHVHCECLFETRCVYLWMIHVFIFVAQVFY